MKRLVYQSQAAKDVDANDVFAIVEKSKAHNPGRGVTGFLLYDDDRFFQLIEGPADRIDALLEILKTDIRHHSITVLETSDVSERLFDDWEMKLLITFSGEPALLAITRKVQGRPEACRIVDLVTDFIGA